MRPGHFGVSRRWPRKRTGATTGQACVQFVGLILPSNSHAEIWTRLHAPAISSHNWPTEYALPTSLEWHVWSSSSEITVMQFTGHSLPAHHFVTAPWDFYLVPYCQPSCILQIYVYIYFLFSCISVYIYVHICACICMYIYIYSPLSMWPFIMYHVYIYIYIYIYI